MRILVSGARGFIGRPLVRSLSLDGHTVLGLRHGRPRPSKEHAPADGTEAGGRAKDLFWSAEDGLAHPAALEGLDAVVHLAGESIAGRWTAAKKRRIRESRVSGTRRLVEALAARGRPPRVFVCASAIGYYGDRGEEELREGSAPGTDFMARLCIDWEAACTPLTELGVRVVNLRIAPVLGPGGGLLGPMLPLFRLGLGGPLGDGRAIMSWIELEDLVRAVRHSIDGDGIAGAVNASAPESVTNAEFTRALGHVLGRPTAFRVPVTALRLAFGEFADAAVSSARVVPKRLLETGFRFRYPRLEPALRAVLGGKGRYG